MSVTIENPIIDSAFAEPNQQMRLLVLDVQAHRRDRWRRVPCVHMERVGVRRLRERLGEYVSRAEAGERIEVTDRGRPVARLEPALQPAEPLEALIAEGLVKRALTPGGLDGLELPRGPISTAGSDAIDELRAERP